MLDPSMYLCQSALFPFANLSPPPPHPSIPHDQTFVFPSIGVSRVQLQCVL